MEKELRFLNIEYRLNENREVEGRAIPFNIQSPNREGFREMVSPDAVKDVFEKSDIFMLYNHDRSKGFLARNNKGKGTLKIDVREDGVYFNFKAKNDNLSNYVYERLESGEISETSWAFTIKEDRWVKGADGIWDRTILAFDQLYDFSVVDQSYYGIADVVGCKRFAEIQEEEKKANEEAMKAAEEAAKEEEKPTEEPNEENREEVPAVEPETPNEEPKVEEENREEPVEEPKEEKKDLSEYFNKIRSEYSDILKK